MNDEELHVRLERGLENLRREFAGKVSGQQVMRIGKDRFDRLMEDAKIMELIPLLVCRETREALLAYRPSDSSAESELHAGSSHWRRARAQSRPAPQNLHRSD